MTAFRINLGVHSVCPVSHGDLLRVNSVEACSSIMKLQLGWVWSRLAGIFSVTSPSTDFATIDDLDPHANKIIRFAFRMVLIPAVNANRGT